MQHQQQEQPTGEPCMAGTEEQQPSIQPPGAPDSSDAEQAQQQQRHAHVHHDLPVPSASDAPALEEEPSALRIPRKNLSAKFKDDPATHPPYPGLAHESSLAILAESSQEAVPKGVAEVGPRPGSMSKQPAQAHATPSKGVRTRSKCGLPNSQMLFNKLHGQPRLPLAALTQQVWSRSVWEVMKGGAPQQRVWTIGNPLEGGGIECDGNAVGRHTSQQPTPLVEGVSVTSVSAGHFHGAAVASGSCDVYLWGTMIPETSSGAHGSGLPEPQTQISFVNPSPDSGYDNPPFHEACPWQPFNAEPVSRLPVSELVPPPPAPTLAGLLEKLPATLREGLRQTDPEGEVEHQEALIAGRSEVRVWRVTLASPVLMVACGAYHTLAALAAGGVVAWGKNSRGQVGLPAEGNDVVDDPSVLQPLQGVRIAALAGGAAHSVAVSEQGEVWAWGDDSEGQLGLGHVTGTTHGPTLLSHLVDAGVTVQSVACGDAHTLCLTPQGAVFSWGRNRQGQLGRPTQPPSSLQGSEQGTAMRPSQTGAPEVAQSLCDGRPAAVQGLPACTSISASSISAAVSVTGRLYLWGYDPALNPNVPTLQPAHLATPEPLAAPDPPLVLGPDPSIICSDGRRVDASVRSDPGSLWSAGQAGPPGDAPSLAGVSPRTESPATPTKPAAGTAASGHTAGTAGEPGLEGAVSAPLTEATVALLAAGTATPLQVRFQGSTADVATPASPTRPGAVGGPGGGPGDAPAGNAGSCGAEPEVVAVPVQAPVPVSEPWMPQQVSWLRPQRVRRLSLGPLHGVAVTEDGGVYAWGQLVRGLGLSLATHAGERLWASDEEVEAAAMVLDNDQLAPEAGMGPPTGGDGEGGASCIAESGLSWADAPAAGQARDHADRGQRLPCVPPGVTAVEAAGGEGAVTSGVERRTRLLGASLQQMAEREGCGAVRLFVGRAEADAGEEVAGVTFAPLLHEMQRRDLLQQQQLQQLQQLQQQQQQLHGRPGLKQHVASLGHAHVPQAPLLKVSFHYSTDGVILTITEAQDAASDFPASNWALGGTGGTWGSSRGAPSSRQVPGGGPSSPTFPLTTSPWGPPTCLGAAPPPPSPATLPGTLPRVADPALLQLDEAYPPLQLAEEPICLVAAGFGHTVMLGAATTYQAPPQVLRRLAVLLISQLSWQYNVQRQALEGSTFPSAPVLAQAAPASAPGLVSGSGSAPAPLAPSGAGTGGGPLIGEASSVSITGAHAAEGFNAATGAAIQVPTSMLQLPSLSLDSAPWSGALIGQQLCLVLCRQVGLIDNLTEYMDILSTFSRRIAVKRGNLPPSVLQEQQQQLQQQLQQLQLLQEQEEQFGMQPELSSPGLPASTSLANLVGPDSWTRADALAASASQTRLAGQLNQSTTHVQGQGQGQGQGQEQGQGQSTGAKQRIAQQQAEQSAGYERSLGLTAEEVLELMLELMADRHPDVVIATTGAQPSSPGLPPILSAGDAARDPIAGNALLRLLCCKHVPLLQLRAPMGLPWVLARVMSPRMLQQLDSGALSEQLHRAYVYMTASHGNSDDLSMSLKDMKMGLRNQDMVPSLRQQPRWQHAPAVTQHLAAVSAAGANAGSKDGGGKGGAPRSPGSSKSRSQASKNSLQLFLLAAGLEAPKAQHSRPLRSARYVTSTSDAAIPSGPPPGYEALEAHTSAAAGAAFTVPLLRAAQFLRQAGLVPKVLSQFISELYEDTASQLRKVPFHELTPWWWPRDRNIRPLATLHATLGAFRNCPDTVDMLQPAVLMGLLNEYDVMGAPLSRTRKHHDRALASDSFREHVEQRRRDRLLAYVLAHLLGNYAAPVLQPDNQKPTYVLALPVSYPQFVELVGACLVVRMSTQHEGGLHREVKTVWSSSLVSSTMSFALESLNLWRERVLSPWKFNRMVFTDAELDVEVDKIFNLFATIDPLKNTVSISPSNYQHMLETCNIYDDLLTRDRGNIVFLACSKLDPDKIYDFAAYAREVEKREHHLRVQAALAERRAALQAESAEAGVGAGGAPGAGSAGMAGEDLSADQGEEGAGDPGGRGGRQPGGSASRAGGGAARRSQAGAGAGARKRSVSLAGLAGVSAKPKGSGDGPSSPSRKRRSLMGGWQEDTDEDAEADAPLPEGWPSPTSTDVQLLLALELVPLTVPRHKAGELTYMQKQQLQADLAELPVDDDWSGLTRRQLGRLSNAPLALNLARTELQEGLRLEPPGLGGGGGQGGEGDGGPGAGAGAGWEGGFGGAAGFGIPGTLHGLAARVSAMGAQPVRQAAGSLGGTGPALREGLRQSGSMQPWSLPADGGRGTGDGQPGGATQRTLSHSTSSMFRQNLGLVPAGPQGVASGRSSHVEGAIVTLPGPAAMQESALAAASLLESIGNPSLARLYRAPVQSVGLTRVRTPEQVHAMRQARNQGVDAAHTDDEITPPPSRQAGDEAGGLEPRAGSPLRLSSLSFSGREQGNTESGRAGLSQQQPGAREGSRLGRGVGSSGLGTAARAQSPLPPVQDARLGSPSLHPHEMLGGIVVEDWGNGRDILSRGSIKAGKGAEPAAVFGIMPPEEAAGAGVGGMRPGSSAGGPRQGLTSREGGTRGSSRAGRRATSSRATTPLATALAWEGAQWPPALPASLPAVHELHAAQPTSPRAGACSASASTQPAGEAQARQTPQLPLLTHRYTASAEVPGANQRHPGSHVGSRAGPGGGAFPAGATPTPGRTPQTATSASLAATTTLNRLTTTRADLDVHAKRLTEADTSALISSTLCRRQFGEAMRQLAVIKFAKISSPIAAWRVMVDRHVLPIANLRNTRFDAYLTAVMGPGVIATVLSWEPLLKKLYAAYAKPEVRSIGPPPGALGATSPTPTKRAVASPKRSTGGAGTGGRAGAADGTGSGRPVAGGGSVSSGGTAPAAAKAKAGGSRQELQAAQQQGGVRNSGRQGRVGQQEVLVMDERVTLISFLKLLQDRRILPEMLRPADLEEVFRRILLSSGRCSTDVEPLTYPQFTDLACMTAMALYDQKKYKGMYHTLEAKLEAFFSMLCGTPLPKPTPLTSDAQQLIYGKVLTDPYKVWWELAALFKPDEEVKAIDLLSTHHYHAALIQELVVPPELCLPRVAATLAEASTHHNNGQFEAALDAYSCAKQQWEEDTTCQSPKRFPGSFEQLGLLTNQRLYFFLAVGSVLMSAGQYEAALEQYEQAEAEAERLTEGHPNLALLHSCRGAALHALGRTRLAYEQLVKAMVIRSQAAALGPQHVDTQLACHNLGCILDRLGSGHRAVELISGALEVFQRVLGSRHPRTETARRNLSHVQHKCIELEMHYKIRTDKANSKGDGEGGQPAGRRRKQVVAKSAPTLSGIVAGTGGVGTGDGDNVLQHGRDAVIGVRHSQLTLQQRLAAFRERRRGADRVHGPHGRCDLLYLGGGMHLASADVLATYESVKNDIALRASGAVVSGILPEVALALEKGVQAPAPHQSPASAATDAAQASLPRLTIRSSVADKTLAPRKLQKRQVYSQFRRPASASRLPPVPKHEQMSVHERLTSGAAEVMRKMRREKVTYVDKLADLLAPRPQPSAPAKTDHARHHES